MKRKYVGRPTQECCASGLAAVGGFVGAGAVVKQDVKPYSLVVGVPARPIGWMSEYGEQIPVPLEGEAHYICPHSGQAYRLEGRDLRLIRT